MARATFSHSPLRQAAVCWLLAVGCPALHAPLAAQQAAGTADSASRKGHPVDDYLLLPVMAAVVAVGAVAPPALLLLRHPADTAQHRDSLPSTWLTAYATAGGMGENSPHTLTYSANAELLTGHLYAAMRVEHLWVAGSVGCRTARVGYLVRSHALLAGGLTVGYQETVGPGARGSLELGLPLVAGNRHVVVILSPTYNVSSTGVAWNYRFAMEVRELPRPLTAGLVIEVRHLREGGPYYGAVALLAGVQL